MISQKMSRIVNSFCDSRLASDSSYTHSFPEAFSLAASSLNGNLRFELAHWAEEVLLPELAKIRTLDYDLNLEKGSQGDFQ